MAATDIVTLNELKDAIKGFSERYDYDDQLTQWISAVSERVDELYGPVVARTVTERLTGGRSRVLLSYPVVEITSVTEYAGTTATVLAAEDFPGSVTANDYYLDTSLDPPALQRRASGYTVTFGDTVVVVYEAGRYAEVGSVGARWKTAVVDVIRGRWQKYAPVWAARGRFEDAVDAVPLFFDEVDPALRRLLGPPPLAIA